MHSVAVAFTVFTASLAASSLVQASVLPLIGSRAPHFAEILQPTSGYQLSASEGASSASFLFTYRNGERADETTASVSLQNDTGIYTIATGLQFVDNWYTVNTTIEVPFATIASGEYTLVAQEQYEGQNLGETTQPFSVKYSSAAPASASSARVASSSSSASSTSSASSSSLSSSASSSFSVSPATSASSATGSAHASGVSHTSSTTALSSVPTTQAQVQAQAQAGSIEQALRSLLSALVA